MNPGQAVDEYLTGKMGNCLALFSERVHVWGIWENQHFRKLSSLQSSGLLPEKMVSGEKLNM
jgi:hypothetical protein